LNNIQTNFSILVWFKSSSALRNVIYSTTTYGSAHGLKGYNIYLDVNGKVHTVNNYNIGAGTIISSNTYNDGKWHFATLTRTPDLVQRLYVDGVYQGQKNSGLIFTFSDQYRPATTLGADYSYYLQYELNGSIDEVMIFNRSLSAAEIKQIYDTTKWRHQNA
jgi:hypothetical protein